MNSFLTPEVIAIVTVGIGLATLALLLSSGTRKLLTTIQGNLNTVEGNLTKRIDSVEANHTKRTDSLEANLTKRIDSVEANLTKRIDSLDGRMATLEKDMRSEMGEVRERMAKLEGLLEGLREAITGQRAA